MIRKIISKTVKLFKMIEVYHNSNDDRILPFEDAIKTMENVEFEELVYYDGADKFYFTQDSMFSYLNLMKNIIRSITRNYNNTVDPVEKNIYRYSGDFIFEEKLFNQTVYLNDIHGVSGAREYNWSSLEQYSMQLKINRKKKEESSTWYQFETEDDFKQTWGYLCQKDHSLDYTEWDNKYYYNLMNGSHRLAAAFRQDKEQNLNTQFTAKITNLKLNNEAIQYFNDNVLAIILHSETYNKILKIFRDTDYKIWLDAYYDKKDSKLLCLPKSDERSYMIYEKILSLTSDKNYFLVNKYFKNIQENYQSN